jgi:hypothetical protein
MRFFHQKIDRLARRDTIALERPAANASNRYPATPDSGEPAITPNRRGVKLQAMFKAI